MDTNYSLVFQVYMTPNSKSKHKININKTNYVFTIGIGYTDNRARTRAQQEEGQMYARTSTDNSRQLI
jgi:hypothetical protein